MQISSAKTESQMTAPRAAPKMKAMEVSSEVFGTLINMAGRQRMLSQRIVLNAVLASLNQEPAMPLAREALALFADSHAKLIKGKGALPGVFFDELQAAYFGSLQGDRKIREFIELAERALNACEGGYRSAPALLSRLGQEASSIVVLLNSITVVYEEEFRRHSASQKRRQQEIMNSIQQIAKQARIVSCNAQIVAARAGSAGREFAVVAGMLSNITGEIDELVHVALKGTMS